MKPRLIRFQKLWHCRSPKTQFTGLGFTPLEAYLDWASWNKPGLLE